MSYSLLIVDDEEALRFMLTSLLTLEGWEVTEASSGEEALKITESRTFDAIILDYRMPGMFGIEVARELRQKGYPADILLYSGYLAPKVEAEAKELDVTYLNKGDVGDLLQALKDLKNQSPTAKEV